MKRKANPNDILIEQILDEALEDLLKEIEHIAKSEDRKDAYKKKSSKKNSKGR